MEKFSKLSENMDAKMSQVYNDIEQAINDQIPIRYKYGKEIKNDIPTEILPESKIKFNNGDTVKDFEVIGLIKEMNNIRDILPKMVALSNNSQITQTTANRINEKFDGSEFQDFKRWLQLVEMNMNQNNNKNRYW